MVLKKCTIHPNNGYYLPDLGKETGLVPTFFLNKGLFIKRLHVSLDDISACEVLEGSQMKGAIINEI